MKLGILAALQEEIDSLIQEMHSDRISTHGMREYHEGKLWGRDCVLVFSRCGKVAAAASATTLIERFGVNEIIFTGVAGGIASGIRPGDVVIGETLLQHDMDASPLFPRHEIPLLDRTHFPTDTDRTQKLAEAAQKFLGGQKKPGKLWSGEIASGDRFFADAQAIHELRQRLPSTLCVEMEGAAVAQVCHEYGIPFSIMRTISDSADEHAAMSFQNFIDEIASRYSYGILKEYFSV